VTGRHASRTNRNGLSVDWLPLCRAAAADVRTVLTELPTRLEREPVVGTGMGGDETTAVDAAAERVVVERLRSSGEPFLLVSEELGVQQIGGDSGLRIVLDPIDGSLNAKRGVPFFALSIAFARGPAMGDVELGYVYDFGAGEEWTAERGRGAFLDGEPLGRERPKDEIEILSFEATTTAAVSDHAGAVGPLAYRLRILGSLALSLCHLAAGRIDAVCSLKAARAVDIAAAQLLVREVGLAVDLFEDGPFDAAPLDVEARSRVVAAGTPALCRKLANALSA
jgi:myo-inositol-1(or 4)-monophosphatase